MGAVAIDAPRRGVFAVVNMIDSGAAVNAHAVRERLIFMAARAIDRLRGHVVIGMLDSQITMATGAQNLLMRRTGEDRGIRE